MSIIQWMQVTYVAAPASLLHCAILFSALIGGYGAAVAAILLSFLAFTFYMVPPLETFYVDESNFAHLVIFLIVGSLIGLLGAAKRSMVSTLQGAHAELVKTVAELRHTNEVLKTEVATRTYMQTHWERTEILLKEGQRLSHTGSWYWAAESGKFVWSEENYRIFGYEIQFAPPTIDMVMQRLHPHDVEFMGENVLGAVARGERFDCEYRLLMPDGSVKYIHASGVPVKLNNNVCSEYVGVNTDVTACRNAERMLRAGEHQFRTLVENLPDALTRYDLNGECIYSNPAYQRLVERISAGNAGYPGKQWSTSISSQHYRKLLRETIRDAKPIEYVETWKSHDEKKIFHFSVSLVPEFGLKGAPSGILALRRDISALKKTEHCLVESRELIRQLANKAESVRELERKHLARELHDDLAQMLLGVRLRLSLLKDRPSLDGTDVKREAADMLTSLDAMITSIRQIMTALRPPALDMGLIAALHWLAADFESQNRISCELNIRKELPPLTEEGELHVFRIIQEALRNVSKHACANRVTVTLDKNEAGLHILAISDDGKGFDPLSPKTRAFGLTGIKERALILGGEVTIDSPRGGGTSIQVLIPQQAKN